MERVIEILNKNEENIITVLIDKAKQGEYTRYTSSRIDDWVLSVRGITKGITNLFKAQNRRNFLHVDENCEYDETVAFGIKEAKLHRSRGVTLSMFLGLIKYYRQAFLAVFESTTELDEVEKRDISNKINLYFDRFEIGFCSEWANISRDSRVSQLQEVNRFLTNEKNKFHTIFQGMAEPVLVVDSERRIREINNAAVKCFDLDYKNVLGKPCYEILRCIHEMDECPLKKAMRKAGKYENLDISIEVNNCLRKFLVSGSFLEDISGKFAGGVELFIDVTESKENELKLLKARDDADLETAKLRAMISGMGEGVIFADASDRIIEVNDFFLNNFAGCSRSDLLGKSIWEFHQGKLQEKVRNLINSFKAKSYSSHVSVTRRINDLEMIMRVQPIYRNDLYQGVLLNVFDVTEMTRARIEAEWAKEQAESANRAKSDFLAKMSHEIRTPMNGILGFAEILLNQELSDEQQESVKAISLCGEQLLELINNILDLSKIESGKMVLEETDFSLENIIKDVTTTVQQKAQDKGLEIRVIYPDDIPKKFIGDSAKIRQILSNLLCNAVKFTLQGSVIISVSKGQGECLMQEIFPLQFEVADTGIGISQDKHELIFDAFSQAEGSISRKFGGTGLGLAICRNLLDLMGGEIWVTSNELRGTIFSFCLPVKMYSDEFHESKNFEPALDGATILVVEDDLVARQIIEIHLRKAGYNVISSASGKKAITYAQRYRPHAVILDLLLPDLSGWHVLQSLKKSEVTQEIPVIICSILPEKEKAISLGAVDYIEKPVREKILLDKIRKHVSLQLCAECHIVLVDDKQVVLDYLSAALSGSGYILHLFNDSKDALIYLLTGGYAHAIILDLLMPGIDGFDFLNRLRSNQQTAKIPVLIYTAKDLTPEDYEKLNSKYQAILEKSFIKPDKLVEEVSQLINQYTAAFANIEPNRRESDKNVYNILVAEDNILNQKIIENFLVTKGYRVTMVNDGPEVLQALENDSFDLILMDMQMPTLDGYETTASIRTNEKWESLPIVALTAYAMKGDEEKCLKAGCNYYLPKPIRKDDLISLIDRITLLSSENKEAEMDMEYLKEIGHLIPFFIGSVEQEIKKAYIALEEGDFKTLEYIGHGLKGSCGAYGFHDLSELGEVMEKSSIDEDYNTLVISVDRFRKKIHTIKDAVLILGI